MATFTLTDLKNVVEKKYAPTIVENGDEKFILKNLLQLPSKKREEVMGMIDEIKEEEEDETSVEEQVEQFSKILEIVVEDDKGTKLVELIGDNAALIIELATTWMEGSELGEA